MADPFPPSLPTYGSPRIISDNRKDTMSEFWPHSLAPPGNMFAEADMMNDPSFLSDFAKFGKNPTTDSKMTGPEYSLSPQSSLSSSTGSSNQQHNRGSSCASSRSGPSTDVHMTNTPAPHGIPMSADPAAGDCLFDFESASSSPLQLETQAVAAPSTTNEVEMPIRPSPNNGADNNGNDSYNGAAIVSRILCAETKSNVEQLLKLVSGFTRGHYIFDKCEEPGRSVASVRIPFPSNVYGILSRGLR